MWAIARLRDCPRCLIPDRALGICLLSGLPNLRGHDLGHVVLAQCLTVVVGNGLFLARGV